jgi:hypothetical protein
MTMTSVPYSPKSLNEGERIILDLHPHWWDFVPPSAFGVAGVVFGFLSSDIAPDDANDFMKLLEWIAVRASWLLAVVSLAWLIKSALQWSRTHFVVTNHPAWRSLFGVSTTSIFISRCSSAWSVLVTC